MKIKIGDNLHVLRRQHDKYGIGNLPTFFVAKKGVHWFYVTEYNKKEKILDEYYICVDDIQAGTVTAIEKDIKNIEDYEASSNNIDEILKNNGY